MFLFLLPSGHAQAPDHRPQELASAGLHLSLPKSCPSHKCRERNDDRITRRITHQDSSCFVLEHPNQLAAASSNMNWIGSYFERERFDPFRREPDVTHTTMPNIADAA